MELLAEFVIPFSPQGLFIFGLVAYLVGLRSGVRLARRGVTFD